MKIIIKNKEEFEIKCFFIDLDGTSLDLRNGKISQTNIDKIREVNKKTPVIISTGRSFGKKVKNLMQILDIKYSICLNGSIIVNKEFEILQDIIIDLSMVKTIKEVAIKYRVVLVHNSDYKIYSSNWYMWPLIFFNRKHYFKLHSFDENKKYNKLILTGCRKKKLFKIFKELKNNFPSLSINTSAKDWIIEITDKKATKGFASLFVLKLLNINPKKGVHIGDSMNDVTTLNHLGALIAMANSSKYLLKIATHIGPNYKKCGLSKVLNGEFLENN